MQLSICTGLAYACKIKINADIYKKLNYKWISSIFGTISCRVLLAMFDSARGMEFSSTGDTCTQGIKL